MRKFTTILIGALLMLMSACQQDQHSFESTEQQDLSGRELLTLPSGVIIERINGEYRLGDDMILTEAQFRLLNESGATRSVSISDFTKFWPGGIVYFEVDATCPRTHQAMQAMVHIEEYTNIRFVPRTNERNYVSFSRSPYENVSDSYVGMIGGKQQIRLSQNASTGTAIHEIGHALGLHHEHQRSDRDTYIEVKWENIESDGITSYQKFPISGYTNRGYFDFSSIMIYSSSSFANGNGYTMVKKGTEIPISSTYTLSSGDITALNQMYPNTPSSEKLNPIYYRINGNQRSYYSQFPLTTLTYIKVDYRYIEFASGYYHECFNPEYIAFLPNTSTVTYTSYQEQGQMTPGYNEKRDCPKCGVRIDRGPGGGGHGGDGGWNGGGDGSGGGWDTSFDYEYRIVGNDRLSRVQGDNQVTYLYRYQ